MSDVPRIGRVLDAVGLLVFLSGAALFVWAWLGFQGIIDFVPPADGRLWSAVEVADGYWRLQKIGGGLMAGGLAVFVGAWWSVRSPVAGVTPRDGD